MTIAELSKSTNRSTDHIFEAICSLPDAEAYENESDTMSDADIKDVSTRHDVNSSPTVDETYTDS